MTCKQLMCTVVCNKIRACQSFRRRWGCVIVHLSDSILVTLTRNVDWLSCISGEQLRLTLSCSSDTQLRLTVHKFVGLRAPTLVSNQKNSFQNKKGSNEPETFKYTGPNLFIENLEEPVCVCVCVCQQSQQCHLLILCDLWSITFLWLPLLLICVNTRSETHQGNPKF